MILVRNTFQLKFGKAKEAKEKIKEGLKFLTDAGVKDSRACMDVTGPFYTLVLEHTFETLGGYEDELSKVTKNPEWQKWYASFIEFVQSGNREIYSVVE